MGRVQEEQIKRCMERLQLDRSSVIRLALTRLCDAEGIKVPSKTIDPHGHG